MHEKHLSIATCKWWFPFILVLKKQHESNGCKVYLLRSPGEEKKNESSKYPAFFQLVSCRASTKKGGISHGKPIGFHPPLQKKKMYFEWGEWGGGLTTVRSNSRLGSNCNTGHACRRSRFLWWVPFRCLVHTGFSGLGALGNRVPTMVELLASRRSIAAS